MSNKKQGHEKFNRFFGFAQAKATFNRFDLKTVSFSGTPSSQNPTQCIR